MINIVVIAISAVMLAFVLVWRRWPAFRLWTEAPKYFMLRQERRFDDGTSYSRPDSKTRDPE
jgi:hypothetical protein